MLGLIQIVKFKKNSTATRENVEQNRTQAGVKKARKVTIRKKSKNVALSPAERALRATTLVQQLKEQSKAKIRKSENTIPVAATTLPPLPIATTARMIAGQVHVTHPTPIRARATQRAATTQPMTKVTVVRGEEPKTKTRKSGDFTRPRTDTSVPNLMANLTKMSKNTATTQRIIYANTNTAIRRR